MPFSGSTFTHVFDWLLDPQRQEKIRNARLEAEFDGIDAALTTLAWGGTTSGQIAFPATQNPSANANTLDDYEEGTWTPAVTFAVNGDLSVSYSTQRGEYTKVGNVVNVWFTMVTATFTHTTASGALQITGLPFAPAQNQRGGSVAWAGITKANYTQMTPVAAGGTTLVQLNGSGSGQAIATITAADMPSGGTLFLAGSIVYQV